MKTSMKKNIFISLLMFFSSIIANQNFVLITMLYNEKNVVRLQEYITCMEKNLAHPLIDTIHVLYDSTNDDQENMMLNYLLEKDVVIDFINGRASYARCFDLANTLYYGRKIILTNADIYFNNTLYALQDYDLTNKFLALTRWNVQEDGNLVPYRVPSHKGYVYIQKWSNRRKKYVTRRRRRWVGPTDITGSQDTWIFQSPIKKLESSAIKVGTIACDNRIAFIAQQEGLEVINPCKTIQCCHLHLSQVRHYRRFKPPWRKVLWVPWCELK